MQKAQPKLDIPLKSIDIILEVGSLMLLGVFWYFVIDNYNALPEKIPSHFNIRGEVDGYGSKSSLFILPTIASMLFIGLAVLSRFPHSFNYPVKISNTNAMYQYSISLRLLRILKLVIMMVFLVISWMTIRTAGATGATHSQWLLPLVLALIFLPIFIYLVLAYKYK